MRTAKSGGTLRAIDFSTLRTQVLRSLREGIVTGSLPAGSVLVETHLAESLGVSRGTVRESLLELQQEQLVEVGPGGRLRVRSIDSAGVRDLFNVRGALEGLAARLISSSPDRADKQAALREKLSVFEVPPGTSMLDMIDGDLSFHRLLCELSGNEVLVHSWRALEGPLRMAIMHAGTAAAKANITRAEHLPFVAALDADVEDPASVVYTSLCRTVDTLIGQVTSAAEESATRESAAQDSAEG